ncbi:ZNF84 protein, partial [Amia calva]|nr:ZNF84 protein [Amia calva]
MAAVYTGSGGLSQEAKGERAADNAKADSANGWGHESRVLVNGKRIKEESLSGDEEASGVQSLSHPPHHAAAAAPSSSLPSSVAVKEESIDEEYFQIKLCEIKQDSDETTEDNVDRGGSHGDDGSNSANLGSMRCLDCGQQFIQWEAFKTHLQEHSAREAEERAAALAAGEKMGGGEGGEPVASEGAVARQRLPKKKKKKDEEEKSKENEQRAEGKEKETEEEEEDEDEEDLWFDSPWADKPQEVFKMRPRVAMLSQEGKPVYSGKRKVYACSVCGKVYSYLESFRNHQKLHALPNSTEEPRTFPCVDCGKIFNRPSALGAHRQTHKVAPEAPLKVVAAIPKAGERRIVGGGGGSPAGLAAGPDVLDVHDCLQCRKKFNSLQTWRSHMELHRLKPYWCRGCAKGFRDRDQLQRHLLGHELKRHRCDLCPKAFRVPAELRYHRNTHTGARPFQCELCQKNFSQLGNLITHRKKHLGVYRLQAGSHTPLGSARQPYGRHRVSKMKVLIIKAGAGVAREVGEEEEEEEEVVEMMLPPNKEMAINPLHLEDEEDEEEEEEENEDEEVEEDEDEVTEEEHVEEMKRKRQRMMATAVLERHQSHQKLTPASVPMAVVKKEQDEGEGGMELQCFECGALFAQESALHLHYMRHASGDL